MSVIIIAEAGVNHNGDVALAKKMIREASECGADYIKFQTFIPQQIVSDWASKADYQIQCLEPRESQLEMLQKLALGQAEFIELQLECRKHNIGFLSTPFDLESISFLDTLDMEFWKIPSGEITNLPYLEKIARTGKPIIMSTGMCEMEEVIETLEVLKKNGSGSIVLLHCNTEYPTPYIDVHLKAMLQMKEKLGVRVGYSDHTCGIEVSIAAVALGADIIEKHFTLDKDMMGPDHKASLDPRELGSLVQSIRNVEKALGNKQKKVTESERKNLSIVRKSLVAKTNIRKGELLTADNITIKRPGTGISPMKWYEVLGTHAKKEFAKDELIDL